MKQFDTGFAATQGNATKQGRSLGLDLYYYGLGVIKNALAELEAGLIVNLRVAVEGEVLGEMIALCKDVLSKKSDEAKNVAAVLIAAAYEGLLRKMGEEFAGVTTRPKLEEVIAALKTADVLKGGQIATAQGFLKFLNDSLHADWANVDRSQVESCLAFSESLLLKHFSQLERYKIVSPKNARDAGPNWMTGVSTVVASNLLPHDHMLPVKKQAHPRRWAFCLEPLILCWCERGGSNSHSLAGARS